MHVRVSSKYFSKNKHAKHSWFQNDKRQEKHMFPWNDDLTSKQSDSRWDSTRNFFDGATLFLDFSINHLCIVSAHWSCSRSRWFTAYTVDDNLLHKTWLAFCWLAFNLLTETLAIVYLSNNLNYVATRKQFFFALLIGHKKWTDLRKTLLTKHQSVQIIKNFIIRRKTLLRQIRFFEQRNLARAHASTS